jgi:hypothetical protein
VFEKSALVTKVPAKKQPEKRVRAAKKGTAQNALSSRSETALERFIRKEALGRTHECVFGVLELGREPVARIAHSTIRRFLAAFSRLTSALPTFEE